MDGRKLKADCSVKPDPSPAEIRQLCWAIQKTWTEVQRREREGCFAVDAVEVEIVGGMAAALERRSSAAERGCTMIVLGTIGSQVRSCTSGA